MDREQLKQKIIDLRREIKTNFGKYVELVNEPLTIDFSQLDSLDPDILDSENIEYFVEQINDSIQESANSNSTYLVEGQIRRDQPIYIASDNLMFGDNLTLETFLRYTVANEYQHSIMIDYLAKDDEYILNLIDELELDDAVLQNELDQLDTLTNVFKKTITQLQTVKDEIISINRDLLRLYRNSFDY